jgi:hypothetical protein
MRSSRVWAPAERQSQSFGKDEGEGIVIGGCSPGGRSAGAGAESLPPEVPALGPKRPATCAFRSIMIECT